MNMHDMRVHFFFLFAYIGLCACISFQTICCISLIYILNQTPNATGRRLNSVEVCLIGKSG